MNTFTEENLREEWRDNVQKINDIGLAMFSDSIEDFWLSKFKAYQSHLLSEGEKMKKVIYNNDPLVGLEINEGAEEAITAYQAIIRDSNHL